MNYNGFTIKSDEWWSKTREWATKRQLLIPWMNWTTRDEGDPLVMGKGYVKEEHWMGCYWEGELVAMRRREVGSDDV